MSNTTRIFAEAAFIAQAKGDVEVGAMRLVYEAARALAAMKEGSKHQPVRKAVESGMLAEPDAKEWHDKHIAAFRNAETGKVDKNNLSPTKLSAYNASVKFWNNVINIATNALKLFEAIATLRENGWRVDVRRSNIKTHDGKSKHTYRVLVASPHDLREGKKDGEAAMIVPRELSAASCIRLAQPHNMEKGNEASANDVKISNNAGKANGEASGDAGITVNNKVVEAVETNATRFLTDNNGEPVKAVPTQWLRLYGMLDALLTDEAKQRARKLHEDAAAKAEAAKVAAAA